MREWKDAAHVEERSCTRYAGVGYIDPLEGREREGRMAPVTAVTG